MGSQSVLLIRTARLPQRDVVIEVPHVIYGHTSPRTSQNAERQNEDHRPRAKTAKAPPLRRQQQQEAGGDQMVRDAWHQVNAPALLQPRHQAEDVGEPGVPVETEPRHHRRSL